MKRIILGLIVLLVMSMKGYCDENVYYAIVNADMSIHTISKKTDDVLESSQKRFPLYIDGLPSDYNNDYYYWGSDGLTRKTDDEVESIKEEKEEEVRKYVLKRAYAELQEIEELAEIDGGDWTEEIEELEEQISIYKKSK